MNVSGNIDDWSQINRARAEGRLFSNLKWPNDPGLVLSYVLVELYFHVILHLS
jgi:callose synthase